MRSPRSNAGEMAHITNPHNARGFTLLWCSTLALLPAIALASSLSADPTPLLLFPGGAPNETDGFPGPEARAPNDGGGCGALHSSACDHIYNVSAPSLTPFVVTNGTGASVVIAPGGGYVDLSWTKEGLDMARMFNRNGVSAFVLKYRVPARPALEGLPKWWAPLQDAQRAIGVVRAGAKRWGLDPGKVGFIGFSAGGHLSVSFELGLVGCRMYGSGSYSSSLFTSFTSMLYRIGTLSAPSTVMQPLSRP